MVGIDTASSLFVLEVLCYIKRNEGNLKQDLSIDGPSKRNQLNFPVEFCITVLFQKSVVYMGMKL